MQKDRETLSGVGITKSEMVREVTEKDNERFVILKTYMKEIYDEYGCENNVEFEALMECTKLTYFSFITNYNITTNKILQCIGLASLAIVGKWMVDEVVGDRCSIILHHIDILYDYNNNACSYNTFKVLEREILRHINYQPCAI
jgi:hypothetical protein